MECFDVFFFLFLSLYHFYIFIHYSVSKLITCLEVPGLFFALRSGRWGDSRGGRVVRAGRVFSWWRRVLLVACRYSTRKIIEECGIDDIQKVDIHERSFLLRDPRLVHVSVAFGYHKILKSISEQHISKGLYLQWLTERIAYGSLCSSISGETARYLKFH